MLDPLALLLLALPAAHIALFSAFRFGSLAAVRIRPSRHSASGVVLAAGFRSPVAARRFAHRWAKALRLSMVVRHRGGLFVVSLPIDRGPASSFGSAWVQGGVRGIFSLAHSLCGLDG